MRRLVRPGGPGLFEGLEPRQLLSTYLVDTASDASNGNYGAGDLSLREAIQLANAHDGADEIRFDKDLGGRDINIASNLETITDAVSIRGIDQQGVPVSVRIVGNTYNLFVIDDGDGAADIQVTLDSLYVYNGASSMGGAVYSAETLTITGCTLEQNSATRGGAVYQSGGSLTIEGSRIFSSYATHGAGVAVDGADFLTIRSTRIDANTAGDHAGIEVLGDGVAVTIDDSLIAGNEAATGEGGGVFIDGASSLEMTGTSVDGNRAHTSGAGVWARGLTNLLIETSGVSENVAGEAGAGLYIRDSAGPTLIRDTTISSNAAGVDYGGGISFSSDQRHLRLRNNTIAYNTVAGTHGAGLSISAGVAYLISNIVAKNSGGGGQHDIDTSGGSVKAAESTNNLIGSGQSGGLVHGVNGNLVGVDPKLDGLENWGHMIKVHRLQADSPAIDAGLNPDGLATDGRALGYFARSAGAGPDIGSYERQTATFTVTTTEERYDEYLPGWTEVSLRQAVDLARGNPGADTIDFDQSLNGSTITVANADLYVPESLTVAGPGSGELTIESSGHSRIFTAEGQPGAVIALAISGLTLTGGSASQGGAVYSTYGDLMLQDVTFHANHAATSGGAVRVRDGSLTAVGSAFSENTTDGYGGAIYLEGEGLTHSISDSTFDANTAASDAGALYIDAGETTSVTVTGVDFTNNTARSGGAIYNYDQSPLSVADSTFVGNSSTGAGGAISSDGPLTITRSTFRANHGNSAGAVYVSGSDTDARIEDSLFESNTASQDGGALYRSGDGVMTVSATTFRSNTSSGAGGAINGYNGLLTITDSTFSGNSSDTQGGGLYLYTGELTVRNSTFSGNAASSGGGMYLTEGAGQVSITDSVIDSNTSTNDSAGIFASNSSLTITRTRISGNSAPSTAGGLFFVNDGTLTVIDSSITGNTAKSAAGLYSEGQTTRIINTTIAGNSAYGYGGGAAIILRSAESGIWNSTIAGNRANDEDFYDAEDTARGGGLMLFDPDDTGFGLSIVSTIIAGNFRGSGSDAEDIALDDYASIDTDASSYNLIGDAGSAGGLTNGDNHNKVGADPKLGDLRDNGSGRQTLALLDGSPAINAGANPLGLTSDQRGAAFLRASGAADIGAYERQTLALVVSSNGDASDGDYSEGNLTLREACELSNANPFADTITFASSMRGTTITLTGSTLYIADSVTITGPGAGSLTIDANHGSRIFTVTDGGPNTVIQAEITGLMLINGTLANGGAIDNLEHLTLRDITITGCSATDDGGAIHNTGTLFIYNSTLSGNSAADSGGAIDNDGTADITIVGSTISGNTAGGESGAIDHDGGTLTITGSTLADNSTKDRGGAIANIGALVLENTAFYTNTAVYGGGAIYNGDNGQVTVTGGAFNGNQAGFGGAIHNTGTLNLSRVEVYNNSAIGNGGGISNGVGGAIDIEYSGISRNNAGGDGGGVFSAQNIRIVSSTVSSNRADGSGGGVEVAGGGGIIYTSTIAYNTTDANHDGAGAGGGIRLGKGSGSGTYEVYECIIAENTAAGDAPSDLVLRGGAEITLAVGNLIGDPSSAGGITDGADNNRVGGDPRLGPLGFYGGKTRVHPLLSGSAAINIGINSVYFTLDQHQRTRGYGGSDDAGAYEYKPTEYSLDSIDGNTINGRATAGGVHRFTIRNPDGDLIVFAQNGDGWLGYNLRELTAAPEVLDQGVLWTDPTDGLTYIAAPSAEGLLLFVLDGHGYWTYRNLTDELGIADAKIPAKALVEMVTRTDRVIIAGLTGAGRLVGFQQTGEVIDGKPQWKLLDISGDLDAQGMTTPTLEHLIGYVTKWDAWNIAGIDADGDIQSVWVHPATFTQWRTDNLSNNTGAPPMSGQLSVTLTSWSAINLGGVNAQGRLVVTWWVPSFKGKWVTSDLTTAADGLTLKPGVVTGFVTPWGAINYAGLTESGEVAAYWWTPQNKKWLVTPLTANASEESPRPVRDLTSTVAPNGAMNVLGIGAEGEAVRLWWMPNAGGWRLDNLSELAVRT